MSEEETKLLEIRRLVVERIERLKREREILEHALQRVKTLQIFEETMKGTE